MIYNPDRPRCSICDAPFRDQSALIRHMVGHRDSSQVMAQRLEKAAAEGLRTQAPWPVGNGGLDECAGEGEVI